MSVVTVPEDGEDEVEIVFNNLDKSNVYRNLMHQKISQQIQLLQAISNQNVPNTFNQFKEVVKKLDCQYSDDVIASAWQRIANKMSVRLSKSLGIKPPVCCVKPLQHSFSSSPTLDHKVSSAVPVALLKNKNFHKNKNCPKKVPKYIPTIDLNSDSTDDELREGKNYPVVGKELRNCSQLDLICPADKIGKIQFKKRKSESNFSVLDSYKTDVGSDEPEESYEAQNSLSNSYANCSDSVVHGSGEKLAMKRCKKRPSQESNCTSKKDDSIDSEKTPVINKYHLGTKAKINVCTSGSRKSLSATKKKEMSNAEIKEFKAEQKRLHVELKREFEIEQLQKVHDRLVDVLIPKYYKKESIGNS